MKNIFDKFMSVIVILAVVGGVGLYFYNMNTYEEQAFDDSEVEKMYLGTYPIQNQRFSHADEQNALVLDAMDHADASYFNLLLYSDTPDRTIYQLSQVNKDEFEEYKKYYVYDKSDLKFMDCVEKALLNFLNYSYKDIRGKFNKELYNSVTFEKCFSEIAPNTEDVIDSYFNDCIDTVFIDNQVELSCDDIVFTKICNISYAEDYIVDKYVAENDNFLCIGNCKVTVNSTSGKKIIDTKIKIAGIIYESGDFTDPYYIFLSNIEFI